MYADPKVCANFLHCVNVPLPNSTALLKYTGSGTAQGVCPWECSPGFLLLQAAPGCAACNAKGFNQSLHVYTAGCLFACLPGARSLIHSPARCSLWRGQGSTIEAPATRRPRAAKGA